MSTPTKKGGQRREPLSQPDRGIKTISSVAGVGKKGQSYKPLKTQFRRGGFDYRQITREGDFAIFEQRWGNSPNVCYEVVVIKRHDGFYKGDQFIEAAETIASSERWGEHGWTVLTRDDALDKLNQLLSRTIRKHQP